MTADSVERWNLPIVQGPSALGRRSGRTVDELQALERAAYEEAFAQGRDAGILAGRQEMTGKIAELDAQLAQFDAALGMLARPLAVLDAEVEDQLMQLAVTIAKQLVRRELRADPGQVIALIREAVSLLPAAARDVRVYMHPEDAVIVRERLAAPAAERAWTIIEDPVLARGGCRVISEAATIDARVEARLGHVISTMLGDERMNVSVESKRE